MRRPFRSMNKRKLLTGPYLAFVLCGTIIPLLAIVYYGFTDRQGHLTLQNLLAISEPEHAKALWLSLLLALICTVICFLLAYPIGLLLRRTGGAKKGFIIFVLILPMWMNFLLRTMAWRALLANNGVINSILHAAGLPGISIIGTPAAVVLGMVYDFLPFMILPIYNVMVKIDNRLIEAAQDLGSNRFQVLWHIILPLSVPGIISGVTMVFVPAMTTFAISNILGGGKIYLIGNIIEQEYTVAGNWQTGSGLSLVIMIFILISMALINKFDKNGEGSML